MREIHRFRVSVGTNSVWKEREWLPMLLSLTDAVLDIIIDRLMYSDTHALSMASKVARNACTPRMRMCLSQLHGRRYRSLKLAFGVISTVNPHDVVA